MLYKTNVVYQNDSAGAGGDTNPPASPSTGGTVAVDAKQLSELVKQAIAEELKPVKGEISGLYSRQDKDRNQFREFMDEFQKQKANNLSDAEAFTATENALKQKSEVQEDKELLRKIAEKVLGSSSPESAGTGAGGADVQAVAELGKYKIDPNSAEAVALLRSMDKLNPLEKEVKLKTFILDQLAPKKPPSPADLVQSAAAGGASKPKDVAALQEEQSQLLKNPSKNMKRLAEIRQEINSA